MNSPSPQVGFNPLTWMFIPDGTFAPEIPAGTDIASYRALLADSGLDPAPGYFQASFSESLAGSGIIDGLRTTCEAMVAEGVRPCLHQHVGTWIETAGETDAVLSAISADLLLLGPDTGHLAWAGIDPAEYIARHLDRVGAVHLKDVNAAQAERSRAARQNYRQTTAAHVWTEPGNGDVDVDLTRVLEVLSAFDGWYVVEVDIADQPTAEETAAVSAKWVRDNLAGPVAR